MTDFRLYSTAEIAELFGVDRHVIYKYRDSGLLKMRKMGHGWKSSRAEIEEFLQATAGKDVSSEDKIILEGMKKSAECLDGTGA